MIRFWTIALAGFIIITGMICGSMSVPRIMMGQANADLWMREPVMLSLLGINPLVVLGYLALMTWLDPGE